MKKFFINLTYQTCNPMSLELDYKVGDELSMESCFFNKIYSARVVKITENKYHNYKFYFVEVVK